MSMWNGKNHVQKSPVPTYLNSCTQKSIVPASNDVMSVRSISSEDISTAVDPKCCARNPAMKTGRRLQLFQVRKHEKRKQDIVQQSKKNFGDILLHPPKEIDRKQTIARRQTKQTLVVVNPVSCFYFNGNYQDIIKQTRPFNQSNCVHSKCQCC